mgnify:CR=1 FL=1
MWLKNGHVELVLARLRALWRLHQALSLWYHPEYAPAALRAAHPHTDLQLDRGERVIGRLGREGLVHRRQLSRPRAASSRELRAIHAMAYIEGVTNPDTIERIFGFSASHADVELILRAQRLAVGGTLHAASTASRATKPHTAVNLGGGFHHARPRHGSGFCVFNDVAIAIEHLRENGFAGNIAIVDLDYHQGDGNAEIFKRDRSVLTFSMHGSVWTEIDAVADQGVHLPTGTGDTEYARALKEHLPPLLADHRPQLTFYIAGNDVLAGDRLGDFNLTEWGIMKRDVYVLELLQAYGSNCVIALGGGYSAGSWRCSTNLVRWLLTGRQELTPSENVDLRAHFERIARELTPTELQRNADDFAIEEDVEELLGIRQPRVATRFLDYYSTHGLEFALQRYGILDEIRRRGFDPIRLELNPRDPDQQMVRVWGCKGADASEHLLVEVVLTRRRVRLPLPIDGVHSAHMLCVEWLLLQDPTAEFSAARPQLPGQKHPGLGLAAEIQELLIRACDRLSLDGVLHHPSHFHTAAAIARRCFFLQPELQGKFLAFKQVLRAWDTARASELVAQGRLVTADGRPVPWEPGALVLPVSDALLRYPEQPAYLANSHRAAEALLQAGLRVMPAAS